MYSTLRELKQDEKYYNKFVIKQNYERCYDDIYDDNKGMIGLERNKNNDYDEERMLPLFFPFWIKDWELDEYNT